MAYFEKFGKADLHIHSNFSDAKMSVEEILDYAENKTDLDLIAITDHDTIAGALKAQKIAQRKNLRVKVIIGEEISCQEGHILALFINQKIPEGGSVKKTLRLIEKQSGMAIAPHPFYQTRFQKDIITIDGIGFTALAEHADRFQAVETFNANPILKKQNRKIQFFNKSFLFKSEIGGSDAHILEAIGVGYTAFEGKSIEELKLAIASGRTLAFSKRWKITTLLKYAFFIMPRVILLFLSTLIHGRVKKRQIDSKKAQLFLSKVEERKDPKISIVIPAYNEEKFLPSCLASLKKQNFSGNYEIIVVDNHSTDDTVNIAEKYGARVVSESRSGVCFARQTGILKSRSDLIVSTDADCTFPEDWLKNIYQAFNENHATIAVFSPFEYEAKPKWGRIYSTWLFKAVEYFYFKKNKLIYVAASNFAFRKTAWIEVGGYNTAVAQGGDEFDLLKKLREKGKVLYLPQNKVRTSSRRLSKGLLYNLFVSLIGYYILDYYLIARFTGRTFFGQWPSYREPYVPQKRNWFFSAIYIILFLFLSLSFIFGSGKVYAKNRFISGGKKVISATKDSFNDIRHR